MNYITEIKAFYDLVQLKQLSTGQIALWLGLMYINNKCAWNQWFAAPNLTLELITSLFCSAILKNRNVLKQLEILDFRVNGIKAISYMLKGTQDSTQSSNTLNKLNPTKLNKTKKESKKEKAVRFYDDILNVLRAGKKDKNKKKEDLEKARNYISREIERLDNYEKI